MKQVILVTGTPCVGKTTLTRQLSNRLGALYVNLTDFAVENGFVLGEDTQRGSVVVDELKMQRALSDVILQSECSVVVDGHFAASVVSAEFSSFVFVLRRNPTELKEFMQKEDFSETKIYENLAAEVLDVCLVEAVQGGHGSKICELDVTGKTVEHTLEEVFAVIEKKRVCSYGGVVDWLGFLEREGLTDQYLKC